MHHAASRQPVHSRLRRLLGALAAVVLGGGLAFAGTAPATAGVFTISIAATNATTQPSGSVFTYQVNVACAATNDPTCDEGLITIPLDDTIGMTGWDIEAVGALVEHAEVVGTDLVITLPAVIPAGTSQAIELRITPPNLSTPDGTTWSLLPSVAGNPETTDPATAPTPATGTATATVPLSVSKNSDRTFYEEGETVTYTIQATCPADADKPLGSIDAQSMTIVDTLPAGIEPVEPVAHGGVWDAVARTITWTYPTPGSVPVECGGTGSDAAAGSFTFEAVVGPVGAGEILQSYDEVTNEVTVSALPLGGTTPATDSDERVIVVLADGDPAVPGTANVDKRAAGPVNRSATQTPMLDATYPGRWLPAGVAEDAPASVTAPAPARYIIDPRTQFPGFEYEIRDALPCLDDLTGVVYNPSAGTCDSPAFHLLGLRLDHGAIPPSPGYTPQYVDLAGDPHDLQASSTGSGWTSWVVPTAALGQVSGFVVPRDPTQADRRSDRITVYGYADTATADGQVLHNIADATWFRPGTDDVVGTDADPADIHIVDTPQVGITKQMANVGVATGPLARLDLTATLLSPGIPDEPLVLTDLLPAGASYETAATAIGGELRIDGAPTVPVDADDLQVEIIEDFVDDRDLLRVTVPETLLTTAGKYTLVLNPIQVRKPTQPGVYDNSAQAFYNSDNLSGFCAAGSFGSSDPDVLRGDDESSSEHCRATAQFSTVTSTSGAFDLRKTVQGDYDDAPQEFPNVGHVKLTDGVADYQIIWQNTGAPTLNGVVLYDIFPHVGDTGVSGNQANQQRDSEFRPRLETIGTAPDGVTISYSASADPCRPEVYPGQGACDDDWTTDPADLGGLAEVLAIRLVSTASYQTGDGILLPFQMSVPTVDKDMVAWNSVAAFAQTTGGTALLPTESPKVGITASDERLALEKTVDRATADAGDTLTYGITVTNVGTSDSVATTASDVLPVGVTFTSASDGGVYDAATRTVTWDVPELPRDESITFHLVVTVDAVQTDDSIVNAASLENPPGYSPPIVASPCADDDSRSCALTTVPVTPTGMATTGATVAWWAVGAALLAVALGAVAMIVRRRQPARHRA